MFGRQGTTKSPLLKYGGPESKTLEKSSRYPLGREVRGSRVAGGQEALRMLKVENLVSAGSFALSALGGAAERARYTVAASSRAEGSWWFPSHPAGWLSEAPGVRVRPKNRQELMGVGDGGDGSWGGFLRSSARLPNEPCRPFLPHSNPDCELTADSCKELSSLQLLPMHFAVGAWGRQRWVSSFISPVGLNASLGGGCIAHDGAGFPLGRLGTWLSRPGLSGPRRGSERGMIWGGGR